jgi:hypothetical protein
MIIGKSRTLWIVALVLLVFLGVAFAEVDRSQVLDLDFTKPEQIRTLVAWTRSDQLNVTTAGLGLNGDANAHQNIGIWTVKPMAVGWWWHPLTSLQIEAEVFPPGKFQFTDIHNFTWPITAGDLYVRYSADASHWSTWQALERFPPTSTNRPQLRFRGTVSVPELERQSYNQWLHRFAASLGARFVLDEGAAANWIQKQVPSFFSTQKPFIGYLDFLWEREIGAGERLKQLRINVSYGRGGKMAVPKGDIEKGYWRFKTSN